MSRLFESPELIGLLIVAGAMLLDQLLGDPAYHFHPVRLLGKLIFLVERVLFFYKFNGVFGGMILLVFVTGLVTLLFFTLQLLPDSLTYLLDLFLIYSCFSAKDLQVHGRRVYNALVDNNLELAQEKVQMIVGRDAKKLDEEGVARAATESMAESFVDGFFAPLFYLILGATVLSQTGFSFIAGGVFSVSIYKVINTLDSMVGYKCERYEKFGKTSARVDDALNFIPSRLAIPVLTLSAFVLGFQAKNAWSIGWRDRLKHTSPNAGHTESTLAGALGIRLGGPVSYRHGIVNKPWMGEKKRNIEPRDLANAMNLIETSTLISGWGSWAVLVSVYWT